MMLFGSLGGGLWFAREPCVRWDPDPRTWWGNFWRQRAELVWCGCSLGCTKWGAHWRHLANMIEPSMSGGDAILCQITFTTWSVLFCIWEFRRPNPTRSLSQSALKPRGTSIPEIPSFVSIAELWLRLYKLMCVHKLSLASSTDTSTSFSLSYNQPYLWCNCRFDQVLQKRIFGVIGADFY